VELCFQHVNAAAAEAQLREGAANLLVCALTMPNCLVVQHVVPESAFALGDALRTAGINVDTRRVFDGDDVPTDASAFDGVVVMGGPMSASSDEGFPSRRDELDLLADALRHDVPTLGVCLGAQLVAVAAGASVHPNAHGPEIGWGPVQLAPSCQDDHLFAGLPGELTVMHWHGETLELPRAAERLISNANSPNQAFRLGDVAWGVQFHLEVTPEAVEGFVAAFAADAAGVPGGADAIRRATPAALAALAPARDLVCGRFADLVATRPPVEPDQRPRATADRM
jgi:GMP synthase-like glutamine amidotransferase